MAVCSSISFISAKTWRVSNVDATANFSTLDAAMQGITAGDTLYLEGSNVNYTLSNPITKKVAVLGPGYYLADNPNTLVNKLSATISGTVSIMAKETLIEGVVFSDATYDDLNIGADDVIIRKCYIGKAVCFTDNNINTKLQIKNTTIMQCYIVKSLISYNFNYDTAYNSVIVNNIIVAGLNHNLNNFVNATIENNSFVGSSFSINNNDGCFIRNNILSGSNIKSTNTNCTINNNYTTGTIDYTTSSSSNDGKWQLAPASQGMITGTNGSQCGAFGGASPYILSGLANIPHIYEIDAPNAASAASGLQVKVKIGTEK